MKKTFLPFLLLLSVMAGCTTVEEQPSDNFEGIHVSKVDVSKYFTGVDGCFLLYNVTKGVFEKTYNEKRCHEQVAACSTFKIPLAVMAFDSGVLADENEKLSWDGRDYGISSWNQDQDAQSWITNSVVWFSQRMMTKLGFERAQKYLKKFEFGNRDLTGGLTTAWLTANPLAKETPRSSLKINAYEQVEFLEKLWKGILPASAVSMERTRKLLLLDHSSTGFEIAGKTGSGFVGKFADLRIGWFVAHLEGNGEEYISVVSFTDQRKMSPRSFGGVYAKQISQGLLHEMGFW